MNVNDMLSIYKEMYYFELNRKHKIHSDASFLVIILLAIIGASSFVFYQLSTLQEYWKLFFLYLVLIIGLFCCMLVSIIYIIRIFHNYGYGYIPRAEEINKYYQQLLSFYSKKKRKMEFEYIHFLIDSFCEYTDMNTKNNEKKLHYISQSRTAIIGSIIFMIACSVVNAVLYVTNFLK